ncbi:MAG: DNA polymerase III subunit chi [Pseudomonadota bacterium]
MSDVFFYHLTRRPLPDTLRMLLTKSRANGWRVAVRGTDHAALETLDQALWLGPEEDFLAHGLAGQEYDADQPILLTTEPELSYPVECLMSVHGAEVAATEVAQTSRVCVLFDGADEAALACARDQWRRLTQAGVAAQYWSEESGRWEKKAQT